ncbi:MAG: four helix bundle protein [Chloroflexi bacterium]|nr:four helix bundle protein [Chloroflexota bacterium]
MPLIKHFEEIRAWQEARELVKEVYRITRQGEFARDFGLRDQIQRASVSVMTNIAEGFDCDSNTEFARFLGYSRRSAVETQSLLYAALDVGYIDQETFNELYQKAEKAKALVGGFRHALKRNA